MKKVLGIVIVAIIAVAGYLMVGGKTVEEAGTGAADATKEAASTASETVSDAADTAAQATSDAVSATVDAASEAAAAVSDAAAAAGSTAPVAAAIGWKIHFAPMPELFGSGNDRRQVHRR